MLCKNRLTQRPTTRDGVRDLPHFDQAADKVHIPIESLPCLPSITLVEMTRSLLDNGHTPACYSGV